MVDLTVCCGFVVLFVMTLCFAFPVGALCVLVDLCLFIVYAGVLFVRCCFGFAVWCLCFVVVGFFLACCVLSGFLRIVLLVLGFGFVY